MLKLARKKSELWFALWNVFPLKLCFIFMKILTDYSWSTAWWAIWQAEESVVYSRCSYTCSFSWTKFGQFFLYVLEYVNLVLLSTFLFFVRVGCVLLTLLDLHDLAVAIVYVCLFVRVLNPCLVVAELFSNKSIQKTFFLIDDGIVIYVWCACVCVCVCVCACVHNCIYTHTHAYIYICVCVCIFLYILAFIFIYLLNFAIFILFNKSKRYCI